MVLLLDPVTPHIAHALWQALGHRETLIEDQPWPKADAHAAVKDAITLAVLAKPKVADFLAGATPKKIIVVPGKIVNIVV